MNGEEKTFFTGLFAAHAEKLGEIKEGQRAIKDDVHEIKEKISQMNEKIDKIEKETPTRKEVAHTVNFVVKQHAKLYHDDEKNLGGFILNNKQAIIKVVVAVLLIAGSALGLGAAGAI